MVPPQGGQKLIKRTRESFIDSMNLIDGGISDTDFEKKYKINKQQFQNLSMAPKDDTKVASNYYSIEDKKNVINYQKKKANDPNYVPKGYELESLKRQTMPGGGLVYSDTNTNSLGATDGSFLAMADTGVKRGIVTVAPET